MGHKRKKKQDALEAADRLDQEMGVFMISIAAELAGMHPQTLRIYEQRGLIKPKRSAKQTRLYSRGDVERLRKIQELTTELGMNLAGVEQVFEMEKMVDEMEARLREAKRDLEQMQQRLAAEVEAVHRSYRHELVLYNPRSTDVVRSKDIRGYQIPIKREEQ